MHRLLSAAFFAGAIVCLSAVGCAPETAQHGNALQIAVIPKGTTHEFWKSIHAGAVKAERELEDVHVIWQGPLAEDDRRGQIQVVETFVGDRADGIVLAPVDDEALVRPVRAAKDVGIPVVIIDSGLTDEDAYVSFVATDNYKGGELAGRHMAETLGSDGGKVILMRYAVGHASTGNREQGFLDEIARHPEIEVISKNQYAGATVSEARRVADALLTRFGEGAVDGIFCPNESSAYGMLEALRGDGRAGEVVFVGFDASDKLLAGLRQGEMHATVVQNPFRMGYEGVQAVVAHLRGREIPKRIDTGVALVTRENLDDAEIRRLVHPPLDEYLK
jgi:ribose transport system substrate-binding protein